MSYHFTIYHFLIYERHLFVHYVPVRVFEDSLVVGTEYQFNDTVGVLLLLFKRQVCHQTHLVAYR